MKVGKGVKVESFKVDRHFGVVLVENVKKV
jgi:hypothetical protein